MTMMDHYCQFPQPDVHEQSDHIMKWIETVSSKTWLAENRTQLQQLAMEVVSTNDKDYSYTGYSVFGRKENKECMLRKILERYPGKVSWVDGKLVQCMPSM